MKDVWGWETQIEAGRTSHKRNRAKSVLSGLCRAFPPTDVSFPLLLLFEMIHPSRLIEKNLPLLGSLRVSLLSWSSTLLDFFLAFILIQLIL